MWRELEHPDDLVAIQPPERLGDLRQVRSNPFDLLLWPRGCPHAHRHVIVALAQRLKPAQGHVGDLAVTLRQRRALKQFLRKHQVPLEVQIDFVYLPEAPSARRMEHQIDRKALIDQERVDALALRALVFDPDDVIAPHGPGQRTYLCKHR